MRKIKTTKAKKTIEKPSIEDNKQYQVYKNILETTYPDRMYEFDKIYDTGEIIVTKKSGSKGLYALRRRIKFKFNPDNETLTIFNYYIDLKTRSVEPTIYYSMEDINQYIYQEARDIKSMDDMIMKYIPLDNFTNHIVSQLVDIRDNIVNNQIPNHGLRLLDLRIETYDVINKDKVSDNIVLIDHIVSRIDNPLWANKFFWDKIDIEALEARANGSPDQVFFDPTWDEASKSWKENMSDEEIIEKFGSIFGTTDSEDTDDGGENKNVQ